MGSYVSDRKSLDHFKIEVIPESLIDRNRNALSEPLRVIRFSELPELEMTKAAVYNDEAVPGRSEPWKVYSHSDPLRIEFTAKLVAQGVQQATENRITWGLIGARVASVGVDLGQQALEQFTRGIPGAELIRSEVNRRLLGPEGKDITSVTFQEVHYRAAFCLALMFPQYDGNGRAFPPPLVRLKYGSNFNFRGVLKNVSLRYLPPWDPKSGLAMVISVSATFEQVNIIPASYLDVRRFQEPSRGEASELTDLQRLGRASIGLARSTLGL